MEKLSFLLLSFAVLILASCGGGSSGGSGSGGGGSSSITYSGVTAAAPIDSANAIEVTEELFASSSASSAIDALGVESGSNGAVNPSALTSALKSNILNIDTFSLSRSLPGVEVDETESCSSGGTMRVELDINDSTGQFDGSLTFNSCEEEGTVLDGETEVSGSISLITFEYDAPFEMEFNDFSITSGSDGLAIDGEMECTFEEYIETNGTTVAEDGAIWCVQNVVIEKIASGETFRLQNYQDSEHLIDFSSRESIIYGRFYHPDIGYVDIGGEVPQSESSRANLIYFFADENPSIGDIYFYGANSAVAHIAPIDSESYTLEIDNDGDGTYDETSVELWP